MGGRKDDKKKKKKIPKKKKKKVQYQSEILTWQLIMKYENVKNQGNFTHARNLLTVSPGAQPAHVNAP
jgi:hypothetical protein